VILPPLVFPGLGAVNIENNNCYKTYYLKKEVNHTKSSLRKGSLVGLTIFVKVFLWENKATTIDIS
jgi:hypothetical protein